MKKILALALACVLVLGLFAGCGAKSDSAKVVYWSMWESTEPQGKAIAESVKAFTEKTGIQVDLQFKGRSGIRDGLLPALTANQVIDVFDEDIDRVNNDFKDYLLDLEELNKKYDYEKTAVAGLMDACRVAGNGTLKTIPYQPNVFAFFYNQKIFDEAGITAAPTTWDELLDACAKIKAVGYIPITCDDAYITCMIGYHLGRLVGEEGVRDIVNNNKWDDPAVAQFAADYAELASLGYFSPNVASNAWPAGQNTELAGGKVGMYLNGSWLPNEVKDTAGPDFQWGCFSYPAVDGGVNGPETCNYGAQVYAINKNSKVSDEAFQLIQFLTKGEADKKLSEYSVGIPADTTNTEWPALLSGVKPVMDSVSVRWSWAVGVESNVDITPAIKENTLKLCGGSITADEFIQNMKNAAG
ncbi:MAG: ABC transporter substrate-binding protein [Eubacteriales bacterium]|nr:ABC transporter substrate-binding protein [Eubacteriales bacterium]